MRRYILFAGILGLAACTSNSTNNSIEQTPVPGPNKTIEGTPQVICFQKLGGQANQDTSSIRLVIEGDQVSGEFSNKPYEKDSRVGTIRAIMKNKLIKGVWIYMQEGMKDTLDIEFKLSDDKLIQKNYTIDPKTGREVFSEGSVFNIEFDKVACSDKTNR